MQPEPKKVSWTIKANSSFSTYIKWGGVLLFWIISISLFSFLSSWDQNSFPQVSWLKEFKRVADNEIGQFHLIQYDSNSGPLYAMGFTHLKVSNGEAGAFHTALYKTIQIQDLYIRSYKNSDIKEPGQKNISLPFDPPAFRGASGNIHDYIQMLLEQKKHEHKSYELHTIDVSNAMQICVDNFQYKILNADNHLHFSLECRKASFSYGSDDIFLRGHVILTASDGRRLESNRIKWDVRKHLFRVEGMYVLQAREHKQRGKEIWVNEQLNIVSGKYVEKNQGKEKPCLAKR
jgi:hypothetical protein